MTKINIKYIYSTGKNKKEFVNTRGKLWKKSINVTFNQNNCVKDEPRGLLCYDTSHLNCSFCEFKQCINQYYKKANLVLVLESPHKDEYDENGNPLRPANGITGNKIKLKLADYITKFCSTFKPKLDEKMVYTVWIVNAIQVQTSCCSKFKDKKDYNKKWRLLRNNVFKCLWSKEDDCFGLKADLKQRLDSLNPTIIINCVTGGTKKSSSLKMLVEDVIKCGNYLPHPSSWV